jgi:shikimate dehydrogenase
MDYGLIGEKLGHSYSKPIHEKLADYAYEITPLTRDDFHKFMEDRDFKAINVTIPYKSDVIPYLDEINEHAKQIGAVNTIVNKNGKLVGYNTDYSGFLYTLVHNCIEIKDKKVIVLGNGGGAKAIIAVLKALKAKDIIIVKRMSGDGVISYEECLLKHSDGDLIINTSPVGMYPNVDESPIDVSLYKNCVAVVDIIYNPLKTKLLLQAEALGMKAVNGLEMLVAQAKYAVEYFLDKKIDDAVIDQIYKDILLEKTK